MGKKVNLIKNRDGMASVIIANISQFLREYKANPDYDDTSKVSFEREIEYQRRIISLSSKFYNDNKNNDMVLLASVVYKLDADTRSISQETYYSVGYIDKDGNISKDENENPIIITIPELGEVVDVVEFDKVRNIEEKRKKYTPVQALIVPFFKDVIISLITNKEVKPITTMDEYLYILRNSPNSRMLITSLESMSIALILKELVNLREKRNKYTYQFNFLKVSFDEWQDLMCVEKKDKTLSERYKDFNVVFVLTNDGVHSSSLMTKIENKGGLGVTAELDEILRTYGLKFFEYMMGQSCIGDIFRDLADITFKYKDELTACEIDYKHDVPKKDKEELSDKCFTHKLSSKVEDTSIDIEDFYKYLTNEEEELLKSHIETIKSIMEMRKVGVN